MTLPHRHPFRLVDRVADGRAIVRLTADATWLRGAEAMPVGLVVEAVAQGAALLLAPPGAPRGQLSLAAIEDAALDSPLAAGDTLEILVSVAARWGALTRVRGELRAGGVPCGRATLVLAGG